MSITLSIIGPTAVAVQDIARDVARVEGGADVRSQVGSAEAICIEVLRSRPDLIIAQLPAIAMRDLAQIGSALGSCPETTLILLTAERSPEILLAAMRAGIREVVPTPLTGAEFGEAVARQLERLRAARGASRREGEVLAFLPAKGGSGATFLATSFAHALSCRGKRVAVIDLNLHLGDAAIFLCDQPVTTTMATLAEQEHRIDAALLEAHMIGCGENLWLLAAPESLDASVGIRPETVAHVIALAASRFDFVVLDVGRLPDAVTLRALDLARRVHLIAQTTLPFLHDGKRLLNLLRALGYAPGKLELVLNRVEKGGDLLPADVRKALQFEQAREIPNSYVPVAYAINHGIPLLRHAPRDPVARALAAWADEWAPPLEAPARLGWLRAFGHGRPATLTPRTS